MKKLHILFCKKDGKYKVSFVSQDKKELLHIKALTFEKFLEEIDLNYRKIELLTTDYVLALPKNGKRFSQSKKEICWVDFESNREDALSESLFHIATGYIEKWVVNEHVFL